MGPPGLSIKNIASQLLKYVNSEVSILSIEPFNKKNKLYSIKEYFDELAEFSERLTHTISDSNKDELIIVNGFFITAEERTYIDNAIKRASCKIDKKYGVWIEDVGSELLKIASKKNISKELFYYLFERRSSPIDEEGYKDIYYISNLLDIGTSKHFSSIYETKDLLAILGKECSNYEN